MAVWFGGAPKDDLLLCFTLFINVIPNEARGEIVSTRRTFGVIPTA